MAYENPIMVELMVPRSPEVPERIEGFYDRIGWDVRNSSNSDFFSLVNPETSEGVPPTIAYWQTENVGKIALFATNETYEPSFYAHGLRVPHLQELVEVCLVVPSNDDVHAIFDQGGTLLEKHTHILPRDHAGAQEFRFADPFNYSLRVTANPGWEIQAAKNPEQAEKIPDVVTKDDFMAHWNPGGAGQVWGAFRRFAERNPDFPLRPLEEEYSYSELRGDLEAAVKWYKDRQHTSQSNAREILQRILISRQQLERVRNPQAGR
jgi:hypothetical protein